MYKYDSDIVKYINWSAIQDLDKFIIIENLTLISLEKYMDWDNISKQELSENFMRKYNRFLNWWIISEHQKMSESFIREFKTKVNWVSLLFNKKLDLSNGFKEEFKELLPFESLARDSKALSEDFIRRHENQVDWKFVSRCHQIAFDFIMEFKHRIHWDFLCYNGFVSDEMKNLVRVIKKIKKRYSTMEPIFNKYIDWDEVSSQPLSDVFIRKYKDKLNWYCLSLYQNFYKYPELIIEFRDRIIWRNIFKNKRLPEKIIELFADRVDWSKLAEHVKLSTDFIRKYSERLEWFDICSCQRLSEEFIREFKDKVIWDAIFIYQDYLSPEFIAEFKHLANWDSVNRDRFLKKIKAYRKTKLL